MERTSDKSREVRLGLVMYGGVSLAIYIFGVAQEFFRAVRGRGVFKLLKALTDSDIVVDIISGTSAGGINGILLAYALANDKELGSVGELWRRDGDIWQLLHFPGDGPENTKSLLRSENYFQPCLEAAFRKLDGNPAADHETEDPSLIQELDLFVTGTDVHGQVYTWFDDAGHTVDVKDHRAVFLLKHRKGRKEPFNPQAKENDRPADPEITYTAMAKLARITSCFPGAFQAVKLSTASEGNPVDAKLRLWGGLGLRQAFFVDGGVLDNKPFTYTLREIFYRLAERPVDRKLFYVEPDPERFRKSSDIKEPDMLATVMRSLVSIPGYESISEDLKMLGAHNDKIKRFQILTEDLEENGQELPSATREFIDRWRQRERRPECEKDIPMAQRMLCTYARTRLLALSQRAVLGVLKDDGQRLFLEGKNRQAAEKLYQTFTAVAFGSKAGDSGWINRGEDILYHFDVSFRLRRLFHLLYACPKPRLGEEQNEHRGDIRHALGRQIKLLEIVQAAMERLVDEAAIPWQDRDPGEVWRNLEEAYRYLLQASPPNNPLPTYYTGSWHGESPPPEAWLTRNELDDFNQALKLRVECLKQALTTAPQNLPTVKKETFVNLLCLTDQCERRMLEYLMDVGKVKDREGQELDLMARYDRFAEIDARLFPLQTFAEVYEKDIIEAIRLSPVDAQKGFSKEDIGNKLAGEVMHHFGGFFKRSWRGNDILWGRLDGLCQLVETLMDPKCLAKTLSDPEVRTRVQSRLAEGGDLHPARLFPQAGPEIQVILAQWLQNLLDYPQKIADGGEDRDFRRHVNLLIAAAQLEVLQKEIPALIEDAVHDQLCWQKSHRGKAPSPGDFPQNLLDSATLKSLRQAAEQPMDPLVETVAVKEWAREGGRRFGKKTRDLLQSPGALDALQAGEAIQQHTASTEAEENPAQTTVGRFFTENIQVGKETLKDIPAPVLFKLGARALLVAANCLAKTAADRGKKLGLARFLPVLIWLYRGLEIFQGLTAWKKLLAVVAVIVVWIILSLASWQHAIVGAVLTAVLTALLLVLLGLGLPLINRMMAYFQKLGSGRKV